MKKAMGALARKYPEAAGIIPTRREQQACLWQKISFFKNTYRLNKALTWGLDDAHLCYGDLRGIEN